MRVIGITGGVGSGKSTLLSCLVEKRRDICLLQTDRMAEAYRRRDSPCFAALLSLLGDRVLGEDGELDSGKMAERIFGEPRLREEVNGLIHPLVKEEVARRLSEVRAEGSLLFCFIESALLLEVGYETFLDEIWYIYADEKSRRERLRITRAYSEEKISGIFRSQRSEEDFRRAADRIIDNSGALEVAVRQMERALEGV